jgi:hypothetical protein
LKLADKGVRGSWAACLERALGHCRKEGWVRDEAETGGGGVGAAQLVGHNSTAQRSTAAPEPDQISTANSTAQRRTAQSGGAVDNVTRRSRDGSQELRDVGDDDRKDFKKRTYWRWFCARGKGGKSQRGKERSRYWQVLCTRGGVQAVARLRLGSHRLEIEVGRHKKAARSQRLCGMCDQGAREDERHFVLECQGYAEIRSRYSGLFANRSVGVGSGDKEVNAWMNPVGADKAWAFWPKFAAFLSECNQKRDAKFKDKISA